MVYSRAKKSADERVAVCLFTPYSSVSLHSASSVCLPPSLTREGSCKSRFWATDGCAFCNRNDLYHLSGGYTASSPRGEPLSIIVLKNGSSGRRPLPTRLRFLFLRHTEVHFVTVATSGG